MPNWCSNNLTVSGDKGRIQYFLAAVAQKPTDLPEDDITVDRELSVLSLERIKPTPKELLDKQVRGRNINLLTNDPKTVADEEADDWFTWRVRNWGTKWDVVARLSSEDEDSVEIVFDSAWSPPTMALLEISKKFPDLEFEHEYDEPGMDFWGIDTIVAGTIVDTVQGPSKIAAEWAEEEDDE